jgi:hypothetical protein
VFFAKHFKPNKFRKDFLRVRGTSEIYVAAPEGALLHALLNSQTAKRMHGNVWVVFDISTVRTSDSLLENFGGNLVIRNLLSVCFPDQAHRFSVSATFEDEKNVPQGFVDFMTKAYKTGSITKVR